MKFAIPLAAMMAVAPSSFAGAQPSTEPPPLAQPRCDYGEPHPDAPEQLSQFAFLIGDYSVSAHAWQGDDWSPPRPGISARWNGWYELGGMAIADEWYGRDPGIEPDSGRGINIRMVDPETGEWSMSWIATGGLQVQHLRAGMVDGVLTMTQIYPERPDFRAIFEIIDEDTWQRVHFQRNEQGEWERAFLLRASRIPCPGDGG